MRVMLYSLLALSAALQTSAYSATTFDTASTIAATPPAATPAIEDSYPRVTELEQKILGQSFTADQLPARLARMEKKAFGAASTSDDLATRTDALTQYAIDKLGLKTTPSDPLYEGSQDDSSQTAQSSGGSQSTDGSGDQAQATAPGDYPHITALEKEILQQTFAGNHLPERLARMETKAFGAPSTNPDLSERTDALERYAEKTLHKKSFEQEQAEESGNDTLLPNTNKANKFLNFMGASMLGIGAGSLPGFGGVRMRPRSEVQQQESEQAAPAPEDPLVNAPTPPPASAKMLTRVGWCEMQIFGHTSPNLHLAARLTQLNKELDFDSTKSGFDLMDDMDKMIKAVEARKPAQQTATTGTGTGTGSTTAAPTVSPVKPAAQAASTNQQPVVAPAKASPRAVGAAPQATTR